MRAHRWRGALVAAALAFAALAQSQVGEPSRDHEPGGKYTSLQRHHEMLSLMEAMSREMRDLQVQFERNDLSPREGNGLVSRLKQLSRAMFTMYHLIYRPMMNEPEAIGLRETLHAQMRALKDAAARSESQAPLQARRAAP